MCSGSSLFTVFCPDEVVLGSALRFQRAGPFLQSAHHNEALWERGGEEGGRLQKKKEVREYEMISDNRDRKGSSKVKKFAEACLWQVKCSGSVMKVEVKKSLCEKL